jgi:hypothetical protein
MKMTAEHQTALVRAITLLNTPTLQAEYRSGNFPRSASVKDLNKRYRWDLFHMALQTSPNTDLLNELYDYLNDTHIETILRSAVNPL